MVWVAPLRLMPNDTVSPGLALWSAAMAAFVSVTTAPLMDLMTSFAWTPALAAGLSGITFTTASPSCFAMPSLAASSSVMGEMAMPSHPRCCPGVGGAGSSAATGETDWFQ